MREIYGGIVARLRDGVPFAVGTLIGTKGSSPAPIGTSLIVDADGSFDGNIGAGCHESEIIEAGRLTLADGERRTFEFNMSDELLDGSVCGAALTVDVWRPNRDFMAIADRIAEGNERVTFSRGDVVVSVPPKRRLVIVGATELASHLTTLARCVDFHVTVVDPRPAFATRHRQPHADVLRVAWPEDVLPALMKFSDAIVMLAHDMKIDIAALRCALDSSIAYIGALGSRRLQLARATALAELGYAARACSRIHGPVGLDLGAVTYPQIACEIISEILAALNGCSAKPQPWRAPGRINTI